MVRGNTTASRDAKSMTTEVTTASAEMSSFSLSKPWNTAKLFVPRRFGQVETVNALPGDTPAKNHN